MPNRCSTGRFDRQERNTHQDANKSNFFELLGRVAGEIWPDHTGVLGDGAPTAVAMGGDVLDELLVLLVVTRRKMLRRRGYA